MPNEREAKNEEKLDRACRWFARLSDDEKELAFRRCLNWNIAAELIEVWSEKDARDLRGEATSEGRHDDYDAPYLRSCGESIIS